MKRRSSSINQLVDESPENSFLTAKFDDLSYEVEAEVEAEYVEEENLVTESSIMDNIIAVITKRMHIYKRDKVGLVCEIIVPVILVILGLSLTKLSFLNDSPVKQVVPSAFPLK